MARKKKTKQNTTGTGTGTGTRAAAAAGSGRGGADKKKDSDKDKDEVVQVVDVVEEEDKEEEEEETEEEKRLREEKEKDRLARMSPVERFLLEVLSWDYLHMLRESLGLVKAKEKERERLPYEAKLKRTPSRFKDTEDYYVEHAEPMIKEECREVLIAGWDEPEYLLYEAQLRGTKRKGAFRMAKMKLVGDNTYKGKRDVIVRKEDIVYDQFMNRDIVLLTRENPNADNNKAHEKVYFLAYLADTNWSQGVVTEEDTKSTVRLTILSEGHRVKSAVDPARSEAIAQELGKVGETWYISRISNLITLTRELEACFRLRECRFLDKILKPTVPEKELRMHWKVPTRLFNDLKDKYNDEQMDAVKNSLDKRHFMLIHGPPGTGKTKLLLGLLGMFVHTHSLKLEEYQTYPKYEPAMTREERIANFFSTSPWFDPNYENPPDKEKYLTVPKCKEISFPSAIPKAPRILVCTPSNSALDEVMMRIKESLLLDEIANVFMPNMVRVGVSEAINPLVAEFALAAQVKKHIDRNGTGGKTLAQREAEVAQCIMKASEIVFCTLSYSGSDQLQAFNINFDWIFVDEAAQAVEPATLIPLTSFKCQKMILIGDTLQLPAMVHSIKCKNLGYNKSLFKRFQDCNYPQTFLRMQYRMHPEIALFPSKEFYGGKLVSGPDMKQERSREWHDKVGFGPFAFYNVAETSKAATAAAKKNRYKNLEQAEFTIAFIDVLLNKYSSLLEDANSLGVIATYNPQVNLIEEKLKDKLGAERAKQIEVNTVDSYQGREKDIIIWCTVRRSDYLNKGKESIGFLKDKERMNVALTRAKSTMIVVGNVDFLDQNEHWTHLIEHAEKRGQLFNSKPPYAAQLERQLAEKPLPQAKRARRH